MNLEHIKGQLQHVSAELAKMESLLQEQLVKVDALANEKAATVSREIRILECTIRDAKARRRHLVVEALTPKCDELFGERNMLCVACDRDKREIRADHEIATRDMRAQRDRLFKILADAAAHERQRELQIRRHRKIPVM